jgi:hypothetical protein
MLISNSLMRAKNAPKKVMRKNLEKGVKTKYSKFGKFLPITFFYEPFLKSTSTNLKSALLPTLGSKKDWKRSSSYRREKNIEQRGTER